MLDSQGLHSNDEAEAGILVSKKNEYQECSGDSDWVQAVLLPGAMICVAGSLTKVQKFTWRI